MTTTPDDTDPGDRNEPPTRDPEPVPDDEHLDPTNPESAPLAPEGETPESDESPGT